MQVVAAAVSCEPNANRTLLVAPSSARFVDQYNALPTPQQPVHLERLWHVRQHIGLDDMDFGDDGIWPTLRRVIGRRGLDVWEATINCD